MILKNDKHRSNLPIVHRVILSREQKILKGDQMKKKLATGILAGLLLMGTISLAEATPTTLISAESNWSYATISSDLWSVNKWSANVGYNTFAWDAATWSTGQAAFGNANTNNGVTLEPYNTYWGAGTDLALQKSIIIDGNLLAPHLKVAVDNGFILFVNGTEVARGNAEGFTSYWEYELDIASSSFHAGTNMISVFAEDHGSKTYFDMQLTADVQPVPEPATMLLFGTGLAGLVGAGLKRRRK